MPPGSGTRWRVDDGYKGGEGGDGGESSRKIWSEMGGGWTAGEKG